MGIKVYQSTVIMFRLLTTLLHFCVADVYSVVEIYFVHYFAAYMGNIKFIVVVTPFNGLQLNDDNIRRESIIKKLLIYW